jgi:hypothetical protein
MYLMQLVEYGGRYDECLLYHLHLLNQHLSSTECLQTSVFKAYL